MPETTAAATPWPVRLASDAPAIETRGLTKRYRKVVALDHADLVVPEGAIYLLVGPNGAGKTTTLSLLLDLIRPTEGDARVLGLDPFAQGAEVRAQLGYVPERADFGYKWMSVPRLIAHHAAYRPGWDADYARELEDTLEIERERKFGKLSKGLARRVELLMALAHKPRLLVLDEPTDGLDPVMRERVLSLIETHARRFPTTILVTTHLIYEAERFATHVAVLDRGRLALQASHEQLGRMVRSYGIPGVAVDPPASIRDALIAVTRVDDGVSWMVWGEEVDVRAELAAAGLEPRDVARPTLERMLIAFLSHRGARGERGGAE